MKSTDKHPWAQNDSRAAFVRAESLTGEVPCRPPPSEEAVEAEVVVTALHWSRRSNHHRVSAIRSTSESRPPPPFHCGTDIYYEQVQIVALNPSLYTGFLSMAINSQEDQFHSNGSHGSKALPYSLLLIPRVQLAQCSRSVWYCGG